MVCIISFFKQQETVRKAGNLLNVSLFRIHEQFPDEIEQRRKMKQLYPHLRQRAVLVKDKLYVDGGQIRVAENGDVVNHAERPVPPHPRLELLLIDNLMVTETERIQLTCWVVVVVVHKSNILRRWLLHV